MYKKRERHDEDTEPVDNDEEQFAHQFFNFSPIVGKVDFQSLYNSLNNS